MESVLELHIKSGEFHHGYLLAGDFESSRNAALEAAKVLLNPKDGLRAHPDFFHREFELFGVKDGADLRLKVSMKPFLGDKKVFVLEISYFSLEAANALLKIFEEPPEGTHFFIIVSSAEDILPTLRSRLTTIDFFREVDSGKENFEAAEEFLKAIPSKRLDMIKKMLGKDFSQNKKMAIEFLNGLESSLLKNSNGNRQSLKVSQISGLEEIQKSREFLSGRAPSIKMILEHLALTLPQVV